MHDEKVDGPGEPVKAKRKKSELFFAVDVRSAARAVRDGINPGVALLVLAAGTGYDHATTPWSVKAIETYTSISRGRAGKAIDYLINEWLVQQTRKGKSPIYRVRPWAEVLERHVIHFPIATQRAFRAIAGGRPVATKDQGGQSHLERLGWTKNGVLTFWHDPEPQFAWLPIGFVTGTGEEMAPPLERLRQTQEPMAFRLALDLYHAQQMFEHGGVPVSVLRGGHERKQVGTFGRFIVWAFSVEPKMTAMLDSRPLAEQMGVTPPGETKEQWQGRVDDLFARIRLLVHCGILEFASQLYESDHVDAAILHPIAWGRSKNIEDELGRAAHQAAMVTMERHGFTWHDEKRKTAFRFVPGDRTVKGMQLIDIARMKYRAHTGPNQAWWRQHNERGAELLASYQAMVDAHQNEEVAVQSPAT